MLYFILLYVLIGIAIELLINGDNILKDCKENTAMFLISIPILIIMAPIWFVQGIIKGIKQSKEEES